MINSQSKSSSIIRFFLTNKSPFFILFCIKLYVLIYLQYGLGITLIKYYILASLLIVIAFIDFDTRYVYSSTVIFGVITGVVFFAIEWVVIKKIPVNLIIGAIVGFLIIWLIVQLTGGMGEGDIDIALIIGIFLGFNNILLTSANLLTDDFLRVFFFKSSSLPPSIIYCATSL